MPHHVQAGIRHAYDGRYLILIKEPKSGANKEVMRLVTGGVEKNESNEHALLREINEETGIPRGSIIYYKHLGHYNHPLFAYPVHYYAVETTSEGRTHGDDRERIKGFLWLKYEKALDDLSYRQEKDVLKEVEDHFQKLILKI